MSLSFKFLFLFAILAGTFSQYCKNSPLDPDNCDYYSECLEAKFHCGPTGYPLGYGGKYCKKFLSFYNDFTSEGQAWISKTLLCLKQALIPVYDDSSKTCPQIYNFAFDSHPQCYYNSGFCSLFGNPRIGFDTIKALLKVFEIRDMIALSSFKQILIVAGMCGGSVLQVIMKFIKDILIG